MKNLLIVLAIGGVALMSCAAEPSAVGIGVPGNTFAPDNINNTVAVEEVAVVPTTTAVAVTTTTTTTLPATTTTQAPPLPTTTEAPAPVTTSAPPVDDLSYAGLELALSNESSSGPACALLYELPASQYDAAWDIAVQSFSDEAGTLPPEHEALLRAYVDDCFYTGSWSGWDAGDADSSIEYIAISMTLDNYAESAESCDAIYALAPAEYEDGWDITLFSFTDAMGTGALTPESINLLHDFYDECYSGGWWHGW